MSSNFHIDFKKNNGNLHVQPSGDFDGNSAWELVNLLHEQYDGQGKVYIDTDNLKEVCPFGCTTFQCRLNRRHLPFERLHFKGEKGTEMAPEGSNFQKKRSGHRCCGNCTGCTCSHAKKKH
ncbi:MAG: peptidylprolyl isomerase [Proteobacteria bacterium]|nr:MAG: peptidylprolyl isomerase [Pseudomonadota bacterium]